jgi:hypothetical protein
VVKKKKKVKKEKNLKEKTEERMGYNKKKLAAN